MRRWQLDLLRRSIDDSFVDLELVVLPTRRRIPRKIDAAIKRERTDKPLNPELENTGQFNVRYPRDLGALRFHFHRPAQFGLQPVNVLDAIEAAYQGATVGQVFEANRVFNVAAILDPRIRKVLRKSVRCC